MGQKRDQRQHVLERINLHASGIDVGASGHHVAVPPGSSPDGMDVRECGAFTEDLIGIVQWLQACGVTTVAMESTGVYWIPLYDLLDSHGFDVHLVDPRQLKRVPGCKTDILDCQWLQDLHTMGLLSGEFHLHAQSLQEADHALQNIREELLGQAGDEKLCLDSHRDPSFRPSGGPGLSILHRDRNGARSGSRALPLRDAAT